MKEKAVLPDVIGKTISGIQSSNWDGYYSEQFVLIFSDGSELTFSNEWNDEIGWTRFSVSTDECE